MEPVDSIRFELDDRIGDTGISPARVPYSMLVDFQKEVGDFLKGSGRDVDLGQVEVAIETGSLAFVPKGLLAATTLWADMSLVGQLGFMDQIDPKRAEIIEKWQVAAEKNSSRHYAILNGERNSIIRVDAKSSFKRQQEEKWAAVEKYIFGQVVDIGGAGKANVHLKLDDGQTLVVEATQEMLKRDDKNRLYKNSMLHITAEENLVSGKMRNHRLIEFVTYEPRYNDEVFRQMVEKGTRAWSDVSDPASWIENLRGGVH